MYVMKNKRECQQAVISYEVSLSPLVGGVGSIHRAFFFKFSSKNAEFSAFFIAKNYLRRETMTEEG